MKKIASLFLCLIMAFLVSCQTSPEETSISPADQTEETDQTKQTERESTHEPVIITESPTEDPDARYHYSIEFADGIVQSPFWPDRSSDKYLPSNADLSANRTEFSDTLNSFEGMADTQEGETFHVAALQMDLPVPEGFHVYVIPGQYWDYTGERCVTLDFVREYVLTVKEVDEEKLLDDIRTYYQKEHWGYNPKFRGPGYVLYSFRVFRKEYLPIESLFTTLLADSGEIFASGDFYVSMGEKDLWSLGGGYNIGTDEKGRKITISYHSTLWDKPGIDPEYDALAEEYTKRGESDETRKWFAEEMFKRRLWLPEEDYPLDAWVGELVSHTVQTGFTTESIRTEQVDGDNSQLEKPNMFRAGTQGCFIQVMDSGSVNYKIMASNVTASVWSDEWWEDYQYALKLLMEEPDRYTPWIEPKQIRMPDPALKPGDPYFDFYKQAYEKHIAFWSGWYADSEKDAELRAYIFAGLRRFQTMDDIRLKDINVFLKDLPDGRRLYIALLNQNTDQLICLEHNWDALYEVDLEFARKYAKEEM